MEDEQELLELLKGSRIYQEHIDLRKLYEDLDKCEEVFCNHFNIHCKGGCGSCCEVFTPDLTPIEANYLAFGMILENRQNEVLDTLKNWNPSDKGCPMYQKDGPYHCTVYRFRPLICRLFGACASRGKEGEPTFKRCKWNDTGYQPTKEELVKGQEYLCEMGDFGTRMDEISPNEEETELLPIALQKALDKLEYIISLEKENKKENS